MSYILHRVNRTYQKLLAQTIYILPKKHRNMSSNSSSLNEIIKYLIPPLTAEKYKGQCGRIAVVGGCREYTGAPYFAAISALKVGVDLVHVFCAEQAAPVIKSYSPELIVHPILDSVDCKQQIEQWMPRMHAVVVGPGLGRDPKLLANVKNVMEVVRKENLPIVIDADGLYVVTEHLQLMHSYQKVILTPNIVEFARFYETVLQKKLSKDIQHSTDCVKEVSQAMGNITILRKGQDDVIAHGNKVYVCDATGSPRRCGGQGDLLAGSMVAFIYWSYLAANDTTKSQFLKDHHPTVTSAFAASRLTRECARLAFAQHRRSTTTTDLINVIQAGFESVFPIKD